MLFSGGESGLTATAYRIQCGIYGNGILLGIYHPVNAADGIRVSLADAFAPKRVIFAVGENGPCV